MPATAAALHHHVANVREFFLIGLIVAAFYIPNGKCCCQILFHIRPTCARFIVDFAFVHTYFWSSFDLIIEDFCTVREVGVTFKKGIYQRCIGVRFIASQRTKERTSNSNRKVINRMAFSFWFNRYSHGHVSPYMPNNVHRSHHFDVDIV